MAKSESFIKEVSGPIEANQNIALIIPMLKPMKGGATGMRICGNKSHPINM